MRMAAALVTIAGLAACEPAPVAPGSSRETPYPPVFATAPVSAIHNVALVLAKLDETQSPSYPDEGFLDRLGLTLSVIQVINVMTSQSAGWCPLMDDIVDNLHRYFDAAMNPNPARDAFTRDWGYCSMLADCTGHRPGPGFPGFPKVTGA